MKAHHLLTGIVWLAGITALIMLALLIIDFTTDFKSPLAWIFSVLLASLAVLRVSAKALSRSKSVRNA